MLLLLLVQTDRLDVRKQQDLSGFYRHLLNQETGSEKVSTHSSSDRFNEPADKKEDEKASFKQKQSSSKAQRNLRERHSSESSEGEDKEPVRPERIADAQMDAPQPQSEEAKGDSMPDANSSIPVPVQEAKPKSEPVPRPDRRTLVLKVFEKRTVGQAFEEAVRRYQERQKERQS